MMISAFEILAVAVLVVSAAWLAWEGLSINRELRRLQKDIDWTIRRAMDIGEAAHVVCECGTVKGLDAKFCSDDCRERIALRDAAAGKPWCTTEQVEAAGKLFGIR